QVPSEKCLHSGPGGTQSSQYWGLVGNRIMLWFLGFHIKRNVFTVYILNLAAADFGFLLCLPGFLITFNAKHLFSVCVLFPIWHRCRHPNHLSAIVCALLWALSCLLSGIVYSLCFVDGTENCWSTFLPMYGLNFLIFAPIMIVSSLILFIKLRRSSQRRQQEKLYTVILLTVLFFLIFAVPLSVQYFLDLIHYSHANELSYLLASINSSINPVIYFLVGSYRQHRFRGCLQVALRIHIIKEIRDGKDPVRSFAKFLPSPTQSRILPRVDPQVSVEL
uniref:G-protein coupled receptors family 1 profile domain-containing protein n=1 Tax=Chelydra serpentina TaxID=8475 RepID=A0A8C3SL57_CHESE